MQPDRREGFMRISAHESNHRQLLAAAMLTTEGCATGDRIAIVANNSVDVVVLTIAALRLGVIPVMVNPSLLPGERQFILNDCQPRLVFTNDGLHERITAAPSQSPTLAAVPLGRPMHYTSGTTGRPKGVYSGVLAPAEGDLLLREEREQWGFQAADVNLVVSPLYHSAPLRFATGTFFAGGDVVVLEKFTPALAAEAISQHAITTAFMAPAHLQRLFSETKKLDLSSFRLLAHAGAPCPTALKREAIARFPANTVWEFYGSTEGQFTVCSTNDWLTHPGTVGRARAGRHLFTVSDERGDVLWCEVPSYARFTYWNDDEKTAVAWRSNAFSVFDVGRIDDDGYVYLEGRRDDLIISGGVNVYPLELEIALSPCPGVQEIVVFAKDDDTWGQRVCAAVVRTNDAAGAEITQASLRAFSEQTLAPYKRPKEYVFVDSVPRTPTGKVRRSQLAEELNVL
jgi:long-chain acyl-CoA synthetase